MYIDEIFGEMITREKKYTNTHYVYEEKYKFRTESSVLVIAKCVKVQPYLQDALRKIQCVN